MRLQFRDFVFKSELMNELRLVLSIFFDFISSGLFIFGLNNLDSLLKTFNCLFAFNFFLFFDLLSLLKLIIIFGFEPFMKI